MNRNLQDVEKNYEKKNVINYIKFVFKTNYAIQLHVSLHLINYDYLSRSPECNSTDVCDEYSSVYERQTKQF